MIVNEIHVNGATLLMPNYVLSRTSPPANFYERKINLGYGLKVDTSDAPKATPEPNKGKKMEDAKTVLDVADKPVNTAAFADGTAFVQDESTGGEVETTTEEAS